MLHRMTWEQLAEQFEQFFAQRCMNVMHFGPFRLEDYIIDCSGKEVWRPVFLMGLGTLVFITAFFLAFLYIMSKIK